jgi:streptogramin lyase
MKKTAINCFIGMGLALGSGCGGGAGDGGTSLDGILTTADGTDTQDTNDTNETNESASTTVDGDGDGDPGGDGDGDPGGDGDADPTDGGNKPKWDLGTLPDAAFNCGDGGGNGSESDFSFLWAANSSQGTITKLDTATVTEVGRYIVRPDSNGSPSRTSVSLSGHVAVANRSGGVTKIYAREDYCEESNGMPGLQTSNSAAFLPWGQEECVAWHVPMNYQSQRPVAWGAGTFNEGTCTYDDEELWTSGTNNNGTIDIYVLDGDDGSTKEMVAVPTGGNGLQASFYGIYGGAVDGNGDFWGSQLGSSGRLIRVNRDDMSYDIWDTPNNGSWYGMTVDSEGYVWLCSSTVARFDPGDETFQTASVGGYTGCMADAAEDGLLWMSSGGNGVVGVNRDTLLVEKQWNAGGSYGISIDFEGYVWAVANGSTASKIDPETGQFWTYNGLVGAYTYSDMTGYALSNVGTPSG